MGKINKEDTGLYRDEGLIILRNCNRSKTDRTWKDIIRIFKQVGFKIKIKTNLKEVDFLNVTFSLKKETHQPFQKENGKLLCIPEHLDEATAKKCATKTIYLSIVNKPSDLLQCSDMELMYS